MGLKTLTSRACELADVSKLDLNLSERDLDCTAIAKKQDWVAFMSQPYLGCFKIFTYDCINSASNSFGARYHAILKYVIFFAVRQV